MQSAAFLSKDMCIPNSNSIEDCYAIQHYTHACETIVGQVDHLQFFERAQCCNGADIASQAPSWQAQAQGTPTWCASDACPRVKGGIHFVRILWFTYNVLDGADLVFRTQGIVVKSPAMPAIGFSYCLQAVKLITQCTLRSCAVEVQGGMLLENAP